MSDNHDIIRTAIRKAIAIRRERGESQASIARAANIHPVTLSNYVRGAKDMCGVPLSALMLELNLNIVVRAAHEREIVGCEGNRRGPRKKRIST